MSENVVQKDVLIAGGGPAGMLLGLLLAKRGVNVLVCEAQSSFEREFRGEVLMPRFSQMMQQLGLLDYLQSKLHLKLKTMTMFYRGKPLASFDFAKITPSTPYATWMPQPVLLQALYDKAKMFSSFEMWFGSGVKALIHENGRVVGAEIKNSEGISRVRAKIVVGADGRMSAVKRLGGFEPAYEDHDFDLIWFNVKKPAGYPDAVQAFFSDRHNYLILPKHPDQIQCGILIAPGEFSQYVKNGIGSIREELISAHPLFHDFAANLNDFNPFSVLQARAFLVKEWAKDGCVLIGDAAHTCSPAGAIGVSVAAQSAIVAAEVICRSLERGDFSAAALSEIQKIRESDVRQIQKIQKRVSGVIFAKNSWVEKLAPMLFKFLILSGVVTGFQRRLFALKKPLQLDKRFVFE